MKWRLAAAAGTATGVLLGLTGVPAAARPVPPNPDPTPVTVPQHQLPAGWKTSADRAVTTTGDAEGLHVLVADEAAAYQWRTAATLAEPGFDVDQWIGTACVTGSGQRAVVVYAPRTYTNYENTRDAGGFVAIVDLASGAVRKLAVRASLAYFNPGCGADESVALSAQNTQAPASTTVTVIDASSGRTERTTTTSGQLASAVPAAGGVVAVSGARLVSVSATGALTTLSTEKGQPFRLHPDRTGGLGYEVALGANTQIRRWAAGHSTLLGTGATGAVQLVGSAGAVFVTGPDSGQIAPTAGSAWSRLAVPVDTEPSTTGALVVLGADDRRAGQTVNIRATLVASHAPVTFAVTPAAPRPSAGLAASPARAGRAAPARGASALGAPPPPGTVADDPDRGCAVARNDPRIQSLQATANQVEWAADRAVLGALTITRPAFWMGSGMPLSWSPQAMFPLTPMYGGGSVPAQVLLGVLAQESNTMQASPHAVDGVTANFNQGGFYGDGRSWSSVDCGYGVGQATSGMAVADGASMYTPLQQQAIATDYASNIAASLNALIVKWNQVKNANIVAGNGDPNYIENWYLAAWAYNTGVQPDARHGNTTGCTPGNTCDDGAGNWGLGWSNNPSNPAYPVDRPLFSGASSFATSHPNLWPYQEKVLGWANSPVSRFDYTTNSWTAAYNAGTWSGRLQMAPYNTFCASINHCAPNSTTDVDGNPGAGQCLQMDLHCWWHWPISWVNCTASNCGTANLRYTATSPEPPIAHVYDPDCNASVLPPAAVIVDDVTTASAVTCVKNPSTWTSRGTFSLNFPASTPSGCTANCITYQGKIDFHQLSDGFGGHLWFTHTGESTTVTATWTPPATTVGWTRVEVHVPRGGGSTTEQADYTINLGNGQTRHRVVNQAWYADKWIDLGTFNLVAGATVTLSNSSPHVTSGYADGRDIFFDALAFIPSTHPLADYVAIGDSYSSGESNQPYESASDQNSPGAGVDLCHRSAGQAYASMVKLAGQSTTIAAMAAANRADFHSIACSGAQSIDLTSAAVTPGNLDNTAWRGTNFYHFGEVRQIDQSGWIDQDTTLVTISVGGDDVGFTSVITGCLLAVIPTCNGPGYQLTRTFGDDGSPQITRPDPSSPQLPDLNAYEPYLITQLRSHLAATYEQIHTFAPNAKVLVVGYPRLFDPNMLGGCEGVNALVIPWLNQMADDMTATITGAVSDTKALFPSMNISFVNAMGPGGLFGFTGHAVCEPLGTPEWINGVVPLLQSSSFHPNRNGQIEYGVLVNAVM